MSNTSRDHQTSKDVKEYLSFILSSEQYALDITSVKEIRGYETVTPIANAPPYIKGVLNLRGDIVPIVDLRIKFNIPDPTYNEFTIVIMLHVHSRVIGIVVDGVSDVVRLTEDEVRPPPDFGVVFDSRFLKGLATVDDHMIILVNIEQLISSGELGVVDRKLAEEGV